MVVRFRFGVAGATALVALVGFSPRSAFAQSTASFPDPTPKAAPRVDPPPAIPAARPAPPSPPPPVSPAPPRATTPPLPAPAPPARAPVPAADNRYPALPAASPPPPSPLLPSGPGLGFFPPVLPFEDGMPIPAGYRVEHRSANGLIIGGLASFIAAYGAAFVVGAGDSFKNGTSWVLVPVIGPWAAIGARSFHCENDPLKAQICVKNSFSEVQTIAILSADAVVQATGAVLFLAGLGSGHDELVRIGPTESVRLTPRLVGNSGVGLGFDGHF